MAGLPTIRDTLADLIFFTPAVTVHTPNGDVSLALVQSLPYQPEVPPEVVPCAWLGDATGDILQGSLEVWTHRLPITIAVHEAGSSELERASVEAFMLAVVKQLRGAVALSGVDAALAITGYEQGEIAFRGKVYRGFTLSTEIEEKLEVANDYWPQYALGG